MRKTKAENIEAKSYAQNKRVWERHNIFVSVDIKYKGNHIPNVQVNDISLGGLQCTLPEKLNTKEIIEVLIYLYGEGGKNKAIKLFLDANVFRVVKMKTEEDKHCFKTSLKFINVDDHFLALLKDYITHEISKT